MNETNFYKIYNCDQLSKEWFVLRKNKITGSTFGDIIYKKFNNHKNISDKIKGKKINYTEKQLENMNNGTLYESICRKKYSEKQNYNVYEVGFYISKEFDFLGYSPDGLINGDGMIEIKCPKFIYYPLLKYDKIWDNHYAQIQGGLYITKRKWCDYVVYGYILDNMYIKRIYYDDKYCKEILIPNLIKFNENYL